MRPLNKFRRLPVATAVATSLAIGTVSLNTAQAGGFALIEIGASGLGNAYAGAAAVAADSSTVWFNPAGMLNLAPREFSVAGHGIAGDATFNNRGTNLSSLLGGAAISGNAREDFGAETIIPNLFYVHRYSDDLAFGFGLTVPFGSSTEYDDDWVGRYSSVESGITVIDLNPTVAYRINDRFSIGGGISVQFLDATLSQAVDSGGSCLGLAAQVPTLSQADCLNAGLAPGNLATDSFAEITGDSVDVTFNLSVLFEPREGTRIGVAYRNGIDHELEGDADFTVNPALAGVLQNAQLPIFQDVSASAGADLPPQLMFSIAHQLNSRVQLLADATWTGWSSLEEIRVQFDNPVQPDSPTPLNWENAWRVSAGLNYQLNNKWTLRGGVAFDGDPTPNANFRTSRVPRDDTRWLSVGAGYRLNDRSSFDVGYSFLSIGELPIDNNILDAAGNTTVRGLIDQTANILSAQYTLKF